MRHFCTAGPVKPDIHYTIPPLERLDRVEVLRLIEQQKYFVLHAPRQTGKTSVLRALVDVLNATGRYRALYINVEPAQSAREDTTEAIRMITGILADGARTGLKDDFLDENWFPLFQRHGSGAFGSVLGRWCERSPLPVVLLIDEIDALVGDSLIAVLRQIRAGYVDRPERFPQSVVLCGVRDVRDYRIQGSKEVVAGGSAFNIKAESLRLGDFTPADVRRLYEQHTAGTGQRFEEEVYPLVWDLTRGQPWLVNALAYEACSNLETGRSQPITVEVIVQAKENLILARATHLDQLADKLREPRVRSVVEPILLGVDQLDVQQSQHDDLQYALDLGLIRRDDQAWSIANAIYREVIPRQLNYITQTEMEGRLNTGWKVELDEPLDMARRLASFQQFFRENSEIWLKDYDYKEAGPHLLMQAFLQTVVNGGGRILREYALGRGRADLLVIWRDERVVIELKLVRGSREKTIAEGLVQTAEYAARTDATESHLVLFDRDAAKSWDDKVFRRDETGPGGRTITVWGM